MSKVTQLLRHSITPQKNLIKISIFFLSCENEIQNLLNYLVTCKNINNIILPDKKLFNSFFFHFKHRTHTQNGTKNMQCVVISVKQLYMMLPDYFLRRTQKNWNDNNYNTQINWKIMSNEK